jgi:hypothetical protein
MRRLIAFLLVALISVPPAAFAQEPQAVDASKMGVSLSRIKRELVQAQAADQDPNTLKLTFSVQVIGTAPKIDLLEGFAVEGPVPYGPPTHCEVLDVLTPKEYRGQAFPILGLAVLATQKFLQYNKKRQCEAEIEEYRRLVMAGVAVAAPRCTQ